MPEPTDRIDNSILHDIKQMLGQEWDDSTYDVDIINYINTVFFNLNQIGVGPSEGFGIMGPETLWSAYIGANKNLFAVKSYIFLRVRLVFDPPANGFLVSNLKEQAEKLEWTLNVEVDDPIAIGPDPIPVIPGDVASAIQEWSIDHPEAEGTTHTQSIALSTWHIPHTFNRLPDVTVYVGGVLRLAEVDVSSTMVTITFPSPTSGIAILS